MFLLVDAGCEREGCIIDQVCTFGNGTQEGLCTECSCIEGYHGTACASETKLSVFMLPVFACFYCIYMLVYTITLSHLHII